VSKKRITWETIKGHLRTCIYIEDDHWLWMLHKKDGYGKLRVDGVQHFAHRLSYIVHVGPIPADRPYVLHKPECHRRDCINPDHLYCGTPQDNMDDTVEGGYHGNLKLTDAQMTNIRQRVAVGESQADVAKDLGVSKALVCLVVNYKSRVQLTRFK
jgi:hypothetical protein